MSRRLLIINTGGTTSMLHTKSGYRPAPGFLQARMAKMPEFEDPTMPSFSICEYDPLLDSSNISPDVWQRIANDIQKNYDKYDAFVVLHGTDTMAYTASALPFMLEGLEKTVILTGSQLPLCLRRNDARENLIAAMILASEYVIPEVCVFFGNRLLRGCRTTKTSATNFNAFDSPNEPPLGWAGTTIQVHQQRIRQIEHAKQRKLAVVEIRPAKIGSFRLFPGFSVDVLENVLHTPLEGLVLETYGAGNGPAHDASFVETLRKATDRGVVIVNRSQCPHGSVSQDDYETGQILRDAGVVAGHDITFEAAITKLMFLFSSHHSIDEIKSKMNECLVGEITTAN